MCSGQAPGLSQTSLTERGAVNKFTTDTITNWTVGDCRLDVDDNRFTEVLKATFNKFYMTTELLNLELYLCTFFLYK